MTVTKQGDVARWSLHDGSLLSVQPCPCPLEADGVVESARSVFYDQAVCVVVREGNDRSTVAVSDTIQYNTIQLYCLCVEKFAFWLVIYIKTFNTVNNKTSTTQ